MHALKARGAQSFFTELTPCISYGRVVRLSVCRLQSIRHSSTVSERRRLWITKSSPTDSRYSPKSIVLVVKSSSRNSKRFRLSEGVKWHIVYRKNSQFSGNELPYLRNGAMGRRFLLMTYRNSHTRFWLVPKSTNLERPLSTVLHNTCVFQNMRLSEPYHENLNEDTKCCSTTL